MAWLRRETLVRPSAAVLAIAVLAAIAAAAAWGSFHGSDVSRRLLAPLIEYHTSQCHLNRTLWQQDLDAASKQMAHTRSELDNLREAANDAPSLTDRSAPHRANAWGRVGSASIGLFDAVGSVGRELRDAWLHEKLTIYHSHLKIYYEGLLQEGVASLPSLPESLEVERKMIELDLQRRYGENVLDDSDERELMLRYASEPPPHLANRVRAPMPKPRDGTIFTRGTL